MKEAITCEMFRIRRSSRIETVPCHQEREFAMQSCMLQAIHFHNPMLVFFIRVMDSEVMFGPVLEIDV